MSDFAFDIAFFRVSLVKTRRISFRQLVVGPCSQNGRKQEPGLHSDRGSLLLNECCRWFTHRTRRYICDRPDPTKTLTLTPTRERREGRYPTRVRGIGAVRRPELGLYAARAVLTNIRAQTSAILEIPYRGVNTTGKQISWPEYNRGFAKFPGKPRTHGNLARRKGAKSTKK